METWRRYVRACRDTAGVGTCASAEAVGVHPSTWRRRTSSEGWCRPYPSVAIAPWATDTDRVTLAAVVAAHGGAVDGATARWRRGLGERPRRLEVVVPHGRAVRKVADGRDGTRQSTPGVDAELEAGSAGEVADDEAARAQHQAEERRWRARCRRVRVRRRRWLEPTDVEVLDGVPTLTVVATALALATTHPLEVRAYLIDARQAGLLELAHVRQRLESVGPIAGRHVLVAALDALEGRAPESVFHDEVLGVLQQLGYHPGPQPGHLVAPRGRELRPDIPLDRWQVALDLEGDRYHRDRDARRRDRERHSAYATTDWAHLTVDHQTWVRSREQVLADLDAAIAAQIERGIGTGHLPPRRTRAAVPGR